MQWLRLYSEARTDNKLRTLTDAQHRVWFNLLCYAGEQVTRGEIQERDQFMLAIECSSGDEGLLAETLGVLLRLRIIEYQEDGSFRFSAWESRQYDKPSDRPEATAERKRRSRKKSESHAPSSGKDDVSRPVTPGHATEQIQNRTDTEKTVSKPTVSHPPARGVYTQEFEGFWKPYPPTNGSKADAFKAWKQLSAQDRAAAVAALPSWLNCDKWREGYVKHAGAWLRGRMWEVAPARASPNGHSPPLELSPERIAEHQRRARELGYQGEVRELT
jgi:hypothetical protein